MRGQTRNPWYTLRPEHLRKSSQNYRWCAADAGAQSTFVAWPWSGFVAFPHEQYQNCGPDRIDLLTGPRFDQEMFTERSG